MSESYFTTETAAAETVTAENAPHAGARFTPLWSTHVARHVARGRVSRADTTDTVTPLVPRRRPHR